jgi:Mg2+ and Co2+ transporter CorA
MEDYNGSTRNDIMKAIADMQETIVDLKRSVENLHTVIEGMKQPDEVSIDSEIVDCLNGNVDRVLDAVRRL